MLSYIHVMKILWFIACEQALWVFWGGGGWGGEAGKWFSPKKNAKRACSQAMWFIIFSLVKNIYIPLPPGSCSLCCDSCLFVLSLIAMCYKILWSFILFHPPPWESRFPPSLLPPPIDCWDLLPTVKMLQQPDAQIQTATCRGDKILLQRQGFFIKTGMSQKGNCRCDLSLHHVAATYRLVCLGLYSQVPPP